MRDATIAVVNLKGLATEVIKNIVLAGIGKLIVVDAFHVEEEDLGAGFFFTDSDVGSNVSALLLLLLLLSSSSSSWCLCSGMFVRSKLGSSTIAGIGRQATNSKSEPSCSRGSYF